MIYVGVPESMNVMYLCDNNYSYIAGISILSLMDNNKDADDITIYLVEDGIENDNKQKLREMVDKYHRHIVFLPKPNLKSLLGVNIELHWWIENVFSRVFLEEVFKDYPSLKRIIYIDCDTLVLGSLSDLWEMDMGDNVCAGVCEAMGNLHKRAIGLKNEDYYFNAGMFLVDLDKWREKKIDDEASKFVQRHKGKLEYADESVLNGILASSMLKLHPKYNITSLTVYFTEKELRRYRKSFHTHTEEERQEALKDARIVHFTSTYMDNRPWIENCNHPYKNKWEYYKSESPWCEKEPSADNRSRKKKIARNIAMKMPRFVRIETTGFVHAYIKPLKYIF